MEGILGIGTKAGMASSCPSLPMLSRSTAGSEPMLSNSLSGSDPMLSGIFFEVVDVFFEVFRSVSPMVSMTLDALASSSGAGVAGVSFVTSLVAISAVSSSGIQGRGPCCDTLLDSTSVTWGFLTMRGTAVTLGATID